MTPLSFWEQWKRRTATVFRLVAVSLLVWYAFWPRSNEVDRLRVTVCQLSFCLLAELLHPSKPPRQETPC